MVFEEIVPRTKIIISASNGTDMQARFMTKVMRNNGEYLMVIPFRHKGMRINFSGQKIKCHLEVRDDQGALWTFKNCRITTIKKDGLVYHKVISPMKNGIENRRDGRRFYVWEAVAVNIDGISNTVFTHLKDVGMTGYSFVIDNKKGQEIKEGTKVVVNLKNKDGYEILLPGMVIRKEKMEKYAVYGCKMDSPPPEYVNFVKMLEKKNTVVEAEF